MLFEMIMMITFRATKVWHGFKKDSDLQLVLSPNYPPHPPYPCLIPILLPLQLVQGELLSPFSSSSPSSVPLPSPPSHLLFCLVVMVAKTLTMLLAGKMSAHYQDDRNKSLVKGQQRMKPPSRGLM